MKRTSFHFVEAGWLSFYLCAFAILFHLGSQSAVAQQAFDRKITLDIPANVRLEDALIEWGSKAGMTVMINTRMVDNRTTQGVRGTLRAGDALSLLLRASGMAYTREGDRIRIISAATLSRSSVSAESGSPESSGFVTLTSAANDTSDAYVDVGTTDSQGGGEKKLDVVLVTAEKRSERLQDVPVPVAVVDGATLLESSQSRLQDYYSSIPGVSLLSVGDGGSQISIRGLTSGSGTLSGNPTVGVTIDDAPYGSSSNYGNQFASTVPDIDPSELARVEVLRGPQGTLYGASSIGGLVKYVTIDPSSDRFSGRVQAELHSVDNGVGAGYAVRGAVNIPINETLAVRASGFTRRDPGYVDNIATGKRGVNQVDVFGGRLSSLWQPSAVVSLKLSALLQDTKGYGSASIFPALGDLSQNELPGTGGFHQRIELFTATLKAKLGDFDFAAVSGYNTYRLFPSSSDYNSTLTQILFPTAANGASGWLDIDSTKTNKLTQEVRLSTSFGRYFDWILGGFYTHEYSFYHQLWNAGDPTTGQIIPDTNFLDGTWPTTLAEYAAFTDITLHITDQLDVQLGGRESWETQTYSETDGGGYGPVLLGISGPYITPEVVTHNSAFTYLVTPRFKISPEFMVYSRLASGFRAGGPNPTCVPLGVPCNFNPDKTKNYEVGVKGDVLGRMLSIDTSVYYIDWKNIQLFLTNPQLNAAYYVNASRAKSEGVEFSVTSNPLMGLDLTGWVAWNEAVLTERFPAGGGVYGVPGSRLPLASRWSGNVLAEQNFPLWASTTGFVAGAVSYVGSREGSFPATATIPRQYYSPYAKADLRAGLKYEDWTFTAFANNFTNRAGVLGGAPAGNGDVILSEIQPRTVGVSASRTF